MFLFSINFSNISLFSKTLLKFFISYSNSIPENCLDKFCFNKLKGDLELSYFLIIILLFILFGVGISLKKFFLEERAFLLIFDKELFEVSHLSFDNLLFEKKFF